MGLAHGDHERDPGLAVVQNHQPRQKPHQTKQPHYEAVYQCADALVNNNRQINMKIKTSELIGPALDWAVAKASGAANFRFDTVATYWMTLDGKDVALSKGWAQSFTPSTDWAQGGPIIEREVIDLTNLRPGTWRATSVEHWFNGPTPLIAAMRCYVASKLGGDEVEVPDELT